MKAGPIAATYDLALIVEGSYRRRLGVTGAYMNGGVAVLDLTAIRSEGLFRAALAYASEYPERCLFAEQDALNAVLDGRWQVLDWRWNSMNYMQERVARTPFIRHFTGNKPWSPRKIGIERRFVNEWRADLSESPWQGRFFEQAPRHAMRAAFEPLSLRVTHLARSLWHSGTDDRRGNKARLANRLPSILSDIERSAANLEKAGAISIQP
jgi:lipopolysaccharide biosynthesis glycosyltransferase